MKLRLDLKLKVKDFFINTSFFKGNCFNKNDISFLKLIFNVLFRLKSSYIINTDDQSRYKIKSKFGGGDVFQDKRKPVNKQASKGIKRK